MNVARVPVQRKNAFDLSHFITGERAMHIEKSTDKPYIGQKMWESMRENKVI